MTTYTTIPDSDIDPESPITSTLITRLRDNAIAIGERDSSVPAALLLFGGLISHTTIINTNATWTPNAATNRIVVMIVGGGGGGGYSCAIIRVPEQGAEKCDVRLVYLPTCGL